ncbi:iron chelate uptake ABC transporter family permease subunit [Dactylosporangium sp. AC04546]|uniref:FecCD family ABC transporter permease n=1 Tax=Dactylosporangium sp. AC04546 TaxID=2862460 RepID=UPI001EDCA741|nr:iron chelate uptake ABC transporter family permease subunit [Dactylosporangium sp. AC04546]WVK88956.1 iron chelate uptake ABC transporter family permease subunit [Dactylosporangium sp. AC04546]
MSTHAGGRPISGVVLRIGPLSMRVRPRAVLVGLLLLAVLAAVGLVSLTTGDYEASVAEVVDALFGGGPPGLDVVVRRFRLPRLLVAIGVGAALGTAGAVFQSVTRNPLGSPDVIGFTTGSATGAIAAILLLRATSFQVAAAAVVGGLLSGLAVYLLSYRRGAAGFRLILVGIGVSAMLASVNTYLLSRASLREAQLAQLWLLGSVNGRSWEHVVPLWASLAVLLPAVIAMGRGMAMLGLGADTASALGVRAERVSLWLMLGGVALTAVATAAAGPIAFVALAAPQIAVRLVRSGNPTLIPAALTGAVLLAGADLAGQQLFGPLRLPAGVTTAAVGGIYLIWLLGREWRKGWSSL